jgi:ACT domain-containing protein
MAKHTSIDVINKLTIGSGIFSHIAYDENKDSINLYTINDSVDIQEYFQPGLIFDADGYWKFSTALSGVWSKLNTVASIEDFNILPSSLNERTLY